MASFTHTNYFRISRNKLVQGADGAFYGTTEFGGANNNVQIGNNDVGDGSIFKVTTNGLVTTLASFNGWNGAHPRGSLIQTSDGNFYGVTAYGMAMVVVQPEFNARASVLSGNGTVFRVTTNGYITTLYSFTLPDFAYSMTNGSAPCGLVHDSNGTFYGTTILGGEKAHLAGYGSGTIFRFSFIPTKSVTK